MLISRLDGHALSQSEMGFQKLSMAGASVRAQKAFALDYCAASFVTEGKTPLKHPAPNECPLGSPPGSPTPRAPGGACAAPLLRSLRFKIARRVDGAPAGRCGLSGAAGVRASGEAAPPLGVLLQHELVAVGGGYEWSLRFLAPSLSLSAVSRREVTSNIPWSEGWVVNTCLMSWTEAEEGFGDCIWPRLAVPSRQLGSQRLQIVWRRQRRGWVAHVACRSNWERTGTRERALLFWGRVPQVASSHRRRTPPVRWHQLRALPHPSLQQN